MKADQQGGRILSSISSVQDLQQVISSIREGNLPDKLLAKVQATDPTVFADLPGDWPEWFKFIKFMNPDPQGRPGNIAWLQQDLERLGDLQ